MEVIGCQSDATAYNFNQSRGKTYQNHTSIENSLANKSYLPELNNKTEKLNSERVGGERDNNESIQKIESPSSKFETTAAFAPPRNQNNISKYSETNQPIDLNQKPFNNVLASESNKIKEMIDK